MLLTNNCRRRNGCAPNRRTGALKHNAIPPYVDTIRQIKHSTSFCFSLIFYGDIYSCLKIQAVANVKNRDESKPKEYKKLPLFCHRVPDNGSFMTL